jgi:uncharacterized membrane protein
MTRETMIRSVVKSLTWRVFGVVILGVISWMWTHKWTETVAITSIFHAIRVVTYVWHERIWLKIQWGIKNEV